MSRKKYINALLVLLGAIVIFHLCIILRIIPYDIAWGGRLQSDSEMFVFEGISIGINLFFALVLLMKGHYISWRFGERTINAVLWVLFFLFVLNTIGNIVAKTNFEKIFAVLTLLFAFMIWEILKRKEPGNVG